MKNLLIITQKVDKNDQLLGFLSIGLLVSAQKFEKVTILCLEKGEFDLPKNVSVISLGKDRNLSKLFWFFNFYKYLFRYRKQYDAVFIHMNPIWVVLGSWYWHMTNKKFCLWYAHKSVTFKLRLDEKLPDIIFSSTFDGFRLVSKKVKVVAQGINSY